MHCNGLFPTSPEEFGRGDMVMRGFFFQLLIEFSTYIHLRSLSFPLSLFGHLLFIRAQVEHSNVHFRQLWIVVEGFILMLRFVRSRSRFLGALLINLGFGKRFCSRNEGIHDREHNCIAEVGGVHTDAREEDREG